MRDGHHRVSVARALGRTDIDAYVTEVRTRVGADATMRVADLPLKGHERLFRERVPLPSRARGRDPARGPVGLRRAGRGRRGVGLPRDAGPRRVPGPRGRSRGCGSRRSTSRSSRCCATADLIGDGTETDAYMRVADERYRLLRTHEWSDEVLARVRAERAPR